MAFYGQHGRALLEELTRSEDYSLPMYNDQGVRAALTQIQLHFEELSDELNQNHHGGDSSSGDGIIETNQPQQQQLPTMAMELRPSLLLHDAAIRRNKRCLLTYHVIRIERMLRAAATTTSFMNTMRPNLSESELEFWMQYEKLRARYSNQLGSSSSSGGGVLDLVGAASGRLPPTLDTWIQVRVVSPNLNSIVTLDGNVLTLEQGTIHYLPRDNVEPWIRSGHLEQVNGEEEM